MLKTLRVMVRDMTPNRSDLPGIAIGGVLLAVLSAASLGIVLGLAALSEWAGFPLGTLCVGAALLCWWVVSARGRRE